MAGRAVSRQRRLARETRLAARAAELERATRTRARRARRVAGVTVAARVIRPTRRRRPYGALPTRTRLTLLVAWVAAQALLWQFVHAPGQRLGLAVLVGACLLVVSRPSLRGPR